MAYSGQNMVNSVNRNLSQLSARKRYFENTITVTKKRKFTELDKAPKLSKEELAQFSEDFKKKQLRWNIKVWGISLLIGGILFITVAQIVS